MSSSTGALELRQDRRIKRLRRVLEVQNRSEELRAVVQGECARAGTVELSG
jgi:hypothetical protein